MKIPKAASDVSRHSIPLYLEDDGEGDYVLYSDYRKLHDAYLAVHRDRESKLGESARYLEVLRERDDLLGRVMKADKRIVSLYMDLAGQKANNWALSREIDELRDNLNERHP